MMNRILWTLCVVGLCAMVSGCGSKGYTGTERFPLSGKITCDGEPVDAGSISFIPAGGGEQRVSGGPITDGTYSVPEAKGANAGKYRVEIRWAKLTGKQIPDPDTGDMMDERKEALPEKYHTNSELTAEVSGDQTTFDFDLKSE